MKFDEIGLEYLEDRKECAVYFNEYDYKDKYKLIITIGEWEDNSLSKEILITKENVHNLKIGDTVKFHNGYEWDTRILGEFELSRGYVTTGVHNETASFVNPRFKSMYFIKDE